MKDGFYNPLIRERIDRDRNKKGNERRQVGLCPLNKIGAGGICSRTKRALRQEGITVTLIIIIIAVIQIMIIRVMLIVGLPGNDSKTGILRTDLKGRGNIVNWIRESERTGKKMRQQKK